MKGLIDRARWGGQTSYQVERCLARKLVPLKTDYLIRICYARYADDLLLGILGVIELLIEIQKCCT